MNRLLDTQHKIRAYFSHKKTSAQAIFKQSKKYPCYLALIIVSTNLLWHTPTKALGLFDLVAICFVSNSAYQLGTFWIKQRPQNNYTGLIVNDLRKCLLALREKIREEQQDIQRCKTSTERCQRAIENYQKELIVIKQELEKYKQMRKLKEDQKLVLQLLT